MPLKCKRSKHLVRWKLWRIYGPSVGFFFVATTVYSLHQDFRLFTLNQGVRIRTWPQVFVVFADQLSSAAAVVIGLTLVNFKFTILVDAAKTYRMMDDLLGHECSHFFRLPLASYLVFLSIFLPANLYDYSGDVVQQLTYLPTYLVYLPLVALQIHYMTSFLELDCRLNRLNMCLPTVIYLPKGHSTLKYYGKDGLTLATRFYWELHRVKKNLEQLFGLPILLLLSHNLLHNIVTPYYVLVNILRPDISRYNLSTWIVQAIWLVIHFVNLALMVWPAESFAKQAKLTGKVIASIMFYYRSKRTNNKLKSLLLQTKSVPCTVSICGIVHLDCKLIGPIMLIITTYLVILVQLKD